MVTATAGQGRSGLQVMQGQALTLGHSHCCAMTNRGKVLDNDDATVGVAGINEQGFIVVFVAKKAEPAKAAEAAPTPSPTPAATPPAAASAAAPAPAAPAPAPAAAAPAPAAASEAAAAAAGQPAAAGGGGVAGFLTGPALEEAVNNICEMGFDRAQASGMQERGMPA